MEIDDESVLLILELDGLSPERASYVSGLNECTVTIPRETFDKYGKPFQVQIVLPPRRVF